MPLYNKVYTDADRNRFAAADKEIALSLAPDMYNRKIHRSTVQSAALLSAVRTLIGPGRKILGAGSYEDLVIASLKELGYPCTEVDPVLNTDLRTWMNAHPEELGTFKAVVSTSVIEHVADDEAFLRDIITCLMPLGYGFLSMDFCESWSGGALPPTSLRFYKKHDLAVRLQNILLEMNCELIEEGTWNESDDFFYAGFTYGFAGFIFRKN